MQFAHQNPAMRTLIIADDLTGACDAAVAFAHRGIRTRVLLDPLAPAESEVVARSTGTRDLPEPDATARVSEFAQRAQHERWPRVFKKIDSVFRGNSAAEIAVFTRTFQAELTVIAPAYPALGRTSSDGVIQIRDLHGERTVPALQMLRQRGLNPHHISSRSVRDGSLPAFIGNRRTRDRIILYYDTAEQADLECLVQCVLAASDQVLWVGSGGLAHALAATIPPRPARLPASITGRVILFVGTDHPVSSRQLAHLRECTDVEIYKPQSPGPREVSRPFGVSLIPVACGTTSPSQLAHLCDSIDPRTVSCILMTGGETAALACAALQFTALDIHRELSPGLPHAIAVGGRFAGVTVVLKSGGFGEADTVTEIVHRFARRNEVCIE